MTRKTTTRNRVRLVSTAGTGTTYWTTKSAGSAPRRLELRKYDKRARRVVVFREAR